MKVFIWIICIILPSVINTFIPNLVLMFIHDQDSAVLASVVAAVLTCITLAFFLFLARKLCKLWDGYRNDKEAKKYTAEQEARHVCKNCGEKLPGLTRVCPKCGMLSQEIG